MKTILKFGMAVIVMGFLVNFLFGGRTENAMDIPALIKSGALVIDVRSAGEFSGGHISGAINIPHNVVSRDIAHYSKDKTKPIIVYCHSGMRSASAKKSLEQSGYTQVINGGSLKQMRNCLAL
jgi:rhodanese-related sulfurtransferase